MSIIEHLQLMLEASALGKNFFEQKYKNSPNYNKVNELVNKEFTNKLTSLEGCPEIVRDSFNCKDNQLESLRFIPEKIDGSLNCSINKLTSLENCPKVINGNFECYDNQLKSLKGCPNVIGGSFNCSNDSLTSLIGGPKIVHGKFVCMGTNIKSLEGAPEKIVGDIKLFDNKNLNDDEVDEYVKKHKFGGKLYKINNESFSSFYYGNKLINE